MQHDLSTSITFDYDYDANDEAETGLEAFGKAPKEGNNAMDCSVESELNHRYVPYHTALIP